MNWRSGLIVILLFGALVSGLAVWRHRKPEPVVAAPRERPDYVLRDFELTSLGTDGHESFTLRAPRLERDPGDQTMSLTTPLFLVPDAEGQYWEMRAESGWVSNGHDRIELRGGVKADGPRDALRPVTMNTDHLTVLPQQNRAMTDAVVTIVQPGSILRGRGFAVSTATKRYVFRSEVKTRYAPSRR